MNLRFSDYDAPRQALASRVCRSLVGNHFDHAIRCNDAAQLFAFCPTKGESMARTRKSAETALLALLRKICLGLPEVRETVKWGNPTFEAGKKIFAVLDHYHGRPCMAFRATPERRESLAADDRFFDAPYAARHGWVCLNADGGVDPSEVRELLLGSY